MSRRKRVMCWKTYVLSRSKVEVIAPFTMDMHRKKVSACLTHAGHGKKTQEWDGRGAHSYTDGMDSPPAQTQRENVLVSFALLKASVADAR